MTNLFGPSNKVVYLKKLVFQSAVRFLILFVLVDTILQKVVFLNKKSGIFFFFLQISITYIKTVWKIDISSNDNFVIYFLGFQTQCLHKPTYSDKLSILCFFKKLRENLIMRQKQSQINVNYAYYTINYLLEKTIFYNRK